MAADTVPEPAYTKREKPHISLCPAYFHRYCGIDNCKCPDPVLKDSYCEKKHLNTEQIHEEFRAKVNG